MKPLTFYRNLVVLTTVIVASLCFGMAQAKKSDYRDWNLDVVFYNASNDKTEADIAAAVARWVSKAEDIYQRRPSLKINYEIKRIQTRGGRNVSEMLFESQGEYAKFMDDHFDNVAVTKTEGNLTVLITDRLCSSRYKTGAKKGDRKCWGGYAHFPHDVNPFSKKRGITLVSNIDEFTFTHELGHVFGLKHTFEPYIGFNLQCNKSYKPKGRPEGECNSCAEGNVVYDAEGLPSSCKQRSNLMDYCTSNIDEEYLNTCQEERAANQRLQYMTTKGDTNYFKLKGLVGEPICKQDSDCESGRYCATGVATVGRNQCKELKPIGASCTAAKQCASDRCNTGKCKTADECQNDNDCGPNSICKLGPLGLGQNQCMDLKSPTCPSGWSYEIRNPLNKDRCNKTTTQTASLKCKLLVTDKAKNWTGPHGQKGADECRSKKGKKPKGVKCPSGYKHNIKAGSDTCTKSNTDHQTPTCPSGWDYKSQSGKDVCQDK
ncbi:zinc-dependent metalloprotease family protein [Arenicella xantha]|uniref:Dickkopf cysteine-rich protein n=1 Tax=Arenicella xantha TaxID=644221 RepID=A0A395JN90_9GAMM|nr:zinc-dependent metalloprotease family protein [Arenicella xantha]RBP49364.1 Dickkopf cysteine-rich protein [Arenicella xantha]